MLDEGSALAVRGSLVMADKNKTYIEQLRRIEYQSARGEHPTGRLAIAISTRRRATGEL